jgi:hypothetical protein
MKLKISMGRFSGEEATEYYDSFGIKDEVNHLLNVELLQLLTPNTQYSQLGFFTLSDWVIQA